QAVRDAVALTVQGSDGNAILVAYVVAKDGASVSTRGLKSFLAARLPVYMVPASIGCVAQIPLTPNGKVNRKILAERCEWRVEQTDYVPPAGKMERLIAEIWEDILGIQSIGANQNFFDLGGHSLLAVRVLSRLRQALGSAIPLAAIFQSPTIGTLARLLEDEASAIAPSALTEIQRGKDRARLSLVPGAGGSARDFAHLARALGDDQPVWSFHFAGASDGDSSIEDTARKYAEELLALQPSGPYLIGGWSFGALVAFEMAKQLHSLNKAVALVVLLDMVAPTEVGLGLISGSNDKSPSAMLAALTSEIVRGTAGISPEELEGLTRAEMLSRAADRIRASNDLFEVPPDLLSDWLSGYSERLVAAASYRPSPYQGPLVLFRAEQLITDDPEFAAMYDALGPSLGWERFTSGNVEGQRVDGSPCRRP